LESDSNLNRALKGALDEQHLSMNDVVQTSEKPGAHSLKPQSLTIGENGSNGADSAPPTTRPRLSQSRLENTRKMKRGKNLGMEEGDAGEATKEERTLFNNGQQRGSLSRGKSASTSTINVQDRSKQVPLRPKQTGGPSAPNSSSPLPSSKKGKGLENRSSKVNILPKSNDNRLQDSKESQASKPNRAIGSVPRPMNEGSTASTGFSKPPTSNNVRNPGQQSDDGDTGRTTTRRGAMPRPGVTSSNRSDGVAGSRITSRGAMPKPSPSSGSSGVAGNKNSISTNRRSPFPKPNVPGSSSDIPSAGSPGTRGVMPKPSVADILRKKKELEEKAKESDRQGGQS